MMDGVEAGECSDSITLIISPPPLCASPDKDLAAKGRAPQKTTNKRSSVAGEWSGSSVTGEWLLLTDR